MSIADIIVTGAFLAVGLWCLMVLARLNAAWTNATAATRNLQVALRNAEQRLQREQEQVRKAEEEIRKT